MANQEVSHINSVRFLNRIIGDIPIYIRAAKKVLSALKRGFYIKSAKEKRKKQPCTERHYQSSVVIKECKTTIYRYREENST